jgi:hypothetical protein
MSRLNHRGPRKAFPIGLREGSVGRTSESGVRLSLKGGVHDRSPKQQEPSDQSDPFSTVDLLEGWIQKV